MEKQLANRRPGRPRKPDSEAKRIFFQTRMREPMRQKMVAAAAENGRSMSEEIEVRLERSFHWNDDFMAAFGGREGFNLALTLFAAFKCAGEARAEDPSSWAWLRDPKAFEAGLIGAFRAGWAQHPGEPTVDDLRRVLEWIYQRAVSKQLNQHAMSEGEPAQAVPDRDAA